MKAKMKAKKKNNDILPFWQEYHEDIASENG